MNTKSKLIACLIAAPLVLAWRGFVYAKLYLWLVKPVFPELPTINWVAMAGLLWFLSALRPDKNDEGKDWRQMLAELDMVRVFVSPSVTLVFGYVLALMIGGAS